MKKKQTVSHYVEWLSAHELHQNSKEWLSELEFIEDEHLFFEDLIISFTPQLMNPNKFSDYQKTVDRVGISKKRNRSFIEKIKKHKKNLKIMVDGVDQLEEEDAYTKTHRELIVEVNDFLSDFRTLKRHLFSIFTRIKKSEKQKRLIDKN